MKKVLLLLVLVTVVSCQNSQEKSWPSGMQGLAQSFQDLIPYVYSENKFNNPLNKEAVEKKIQNFSDSIHHISGEKAQQLYGNDPLMLKGLENLKEISSRALTYYHLGKYNYSQNLLKQSAKYCFQCHTRIPAGPQLVFWNKFNIESYDLAPHEKAQIYVAMRQYDNAKKELTSFVKNPTAAQNMTLLREQDIKYYLLIAIRGQTQFAEANGFISEQIKNDKLSDYFRENLKTWSKDLIYWSKNFDKTPKNLSSAKKVLGTNKKKNLELNEAQFIKALVAALMIHEGLAKEKDNAVIAESYFYLGRIYEHFTVGGFWDLSDFYYEICIDSLPHSQISQKCVDRLNESLIIKNTGTRGLVLPQVELDRLKELERRANFKK